MQCHPLIKSGQALIAAKDLVAIRSFAALRMTLFDFHFIRAVIIVIPAPRLKHSGAGMTAFTVAMIGNWNYF